MLPEDNALWYGLVGQSLIAPATLLALGSGLIPLHGKSESRVTSAKPAFSRMGKFSKEKVLADINIPDYEPDPHYEPPPDRVPLQPGQGVVYFPDPWPTAGPYRKPFYPVYPDEEKPRAPALNKPLAFGPSFSMGTQRNPKNRARRGKGKSKSKSGKRAAMIPTRSVPRPMNMGTTGFESIFVDRSSTSLNLVSQTPIHTVLGKRGIRIIGKQPFSNVVDQATQIGPLTNATLATFTNYATILLSPDLFNGPLAAQANLYDHYVFRRLRVEYISTCSSAQTGAIVMGFRDDPAPVSMATVDFSNVRSLSNSVTFPCRESRTVIDYKYNGSMVWNTLFSNVTVADTRLTAQAAFNICLDTVRATGTNNPLGFLNVYYDIELYCPGTSHGFTSDRKTKERLPSPPSYEDHTSAAPGGAADMVIVTEGERTLLQKLIGR